MNKESLQVIGASVVALLIGGVILAAIVLFAGAFFTLNGR